MAIAPAVSQRAQPPCVRLISAGLIEQHHQSEASTRRYLSEASMRQLDAFDLALIGTDAGMLSGVIRIPELTAAYSENTALRGDGGSQPVRELMLSGTSDMTWEYTGTAWLTYLGQTEGIPDSTAQYEAVRDLDATDNLTWLPPAPLNNTYAMAVRSNAVADLGGISKMSEFLALPVADLTF